MASLLQALRQGYYPHQLAWLLDNPFRRLLITPRAMADRLPLTRSSQVLEVGPGSGYFSTELARRVPDGRLELMDLQAEMVQKAVKKFGAALPSNVGWSVADANEGLPYPDVSFDVILLVAVLGELAVPALALRSLFAVLKDGGILAVHEHIPDPDRIRPKKLSALAEAAGFAFVRRHGPSWNYTALYEKPSNRATNSPSLT